MVAMCRTACAATPVDVIKPDLHALIRAAAPSPVQFAVHVPHAVSSATSGTWSNSNGRATWRFNARIPTAVSMSFHANPVNLPVDAVLTVRGARTSHRSQALWVRRPYHKAAALTETPPRPCGAGEYSNQPDSGYGIEIGAAWVTEPADFGPQAL